MTAQNAYENLRLRNLPYWKLYHGANKVSQCDKDENPEGDTALAAQLFEEEISTRLVTPGSYTVNVYRNINGEKGGFKYTFTISGTEQMNGFTRQLPAGEDIYSRIQRDIETKMAIDRIEKKVDAIGEFIASKQTESKDDDDGAFKLLMGFFGQAMKNKTGSTVPAGNSFANLR